MLRVIKADIEALFEAIREWFSGRVTAVHTCMADGTHGDIWSGELRQVATCAIFVAGKSRSRRVVGSVMTAGAADRCML